MVKQTEVDVLKSVLEKPSADEFVERIVESQDDFFPSVDQITISEPFVDAFATPKWCDRENYAFCWVDLRDDIERHKALEVNYWKVVTRSSSCLKGKITERDFRDHGAVERRGMFLVFRPRDLDAHIRHIPVQTHADLISSTKTPKKEALYEVSGVIQGTAAEGKMDVVAFEEAGEPGIKFAEK